MRWALLALAMTFSGSVLAQDRLAPSRPPPLAPVSGAVHVQVMCVQATNSNSEVDPRLRDMMQHLRFTKYTGFHLKDTHDAEVTVGDSTTFAVEGSRHIKIDLLARDATEARMRIRMFNSQGSQQLDTTVSIHRNRSFIVAGPRIGEDVLILPVTARY